MKGKGRRGGELIGNKRWDNEKDIGQKRGMANIENEERIEKVGRDERGGRYVERKEKIGGERTERVYWK